VGWTPRIDGARGAPSIIANFIVWKARANFPEARLWKLPGSRHLKVGRG
jgi:hypothetical protein